MPPRIRKAVIPLGGRATRLFPASASVRKGLFPIVDCDGLVKPIIQLIVEEAIKSGIEQVALVVAPGDEAAYRQPFVALANPPVTTRPSGASELPVWQESLLDRITFVEQPSPEGYGHAVWCAREFVDGEPCLVMLGDHVYVTSEEASPKNPATGGRQCARQLLDVFARFGAATSAMSVVGGEALPYFGTARGRLVAGESAVYEVEELVEKPSVEYARSHLTTEGLPTDRYLCFFGLHAMTPAIFDLLDDAVRTNSRQHGEVQLTAAQVALRDRERYLAFVVAGERHDTGVPQGLIETQVALALRSPHADLVRNLVSGAEARRSGR